MRKIKIFSLTFVLIIGLCSCSAGSAEFNVETLKGWSFQFNEGTNDYSLFFGLLDKNGNYLAADGSVDIRIVNEKEETVYTATKNFSKDDFGNYTSQIAGEQFLVNVRIPASDIEEGKSSSGKVFLTVYNENAYAFDEVNCEATYCLPVSDINLIHGDFPQEIEVTGYLGGTDAILRITDLTYEFDKEYIPQLKITLFGEKVFGKDSSGVAYDVIDYKLYDCEGYSIDSGSVFLDSLREGERFKDSSIVIYDITPGETYELHLMERSW